MRLIYYFQHFSFKSDGFLNSNLLEFFVFCADFDACLPWTATLYPQEPVSCCLCS